MTVLGRLCEYRVPFEGIAHGDVIELKRSPDAIVLLQIKSQADLSSRNVEGRELVSSYKLYVFRLKSI